MPKELVVVAHRGDAKTLLAFDLPKAQTKNLAGFTVQCEPQEQAPYYLMNTLRFHDPSQHAQDEKERTSSSLNAPFQKFRWLHVPGSVHQGLEPFFGRYTYTVTPRYFDADGSMQPLDPELSRSVAIEVAPFEKKKLKLGFTRGYTQSQAFVHHFGLKAKIRPEGRQLLFDTSAVSGKNAAGEEFTYQQEYGWLGFTARKRIFEVLDEVLGDKQLQLDVFAYDLNEPDFIAGLLTLGKQGRLRIILDNAPLHTSSPEKPAPEDAFEKELKRVAKAKAAILRGKFGRFAHDKILIVSRRSAATGKPKPLCVLTGSTNFSVTGLYVNSNHVLVFDDPAVAQTYAEVFQTAWDQDVKKAAFAKSALAQAPTSFGSSKTPPTEVTYSPHTEEIATEVLDGVVARINKEQKARGSVLFAVMELGKGTGPVFPALRSLHTNADVFSAGITDTTDGTALYAPGKKTGVLVTGKPGKSSLPPPFDQVPGVGLGHQVHHKFVVCGFNTKDAVVYCGSSNLALMGEQVNGDNLLAVHDRDVATVFAIEALSLVDHFQFLQRNAAKANKKPTAKPPANKTHAAVAAGWFLSTDGDWAAPYYDPKDLHARDRQLFSRNSD